MKPSIPRGTRDFSPSDMQKRNYILNCIRKNFELYGFQQIETPAMENLDTLTGKYGDEGDKLIFKIRSNRNVFNTYPEAKDKIKDILKDVADIDYTFLAHKSETALRYDLTVPFARYVVMNQNEITFPFRRYQIQPVWRADRPQKGRYREFYQCDADIIGSNSLVNELDLIALMDKSFAEMKVPVVLKVNNRKILAGVAEAAGVPDRMLDIAIAIDKHEKIGLNGVISELQSKGFDNNQIGTVLQICETQSPTDFSKGTELDLKVDLKTYLSPMQKLESMKINPEFKNSSIFQEGIKELQYIFQYKPQYLNLELDFSLARGLNYYTGTIFEVKANAGTFTPSILGGGRYDDLTGIFGLPNMSGVGISFGIDRIYDVMEELNLFPENISKAPSSTLLFTHFDEASQSHCLQLATELRKQNISCEVYPDVTKKIGKQFDYANKKNIPFVCTVGSNEMEKQIYSIKNMSKGEKRELNLNDMIDYLKTELK